MSAFNVSVGKLGTLEVTAPYDKKFITGAKELGGKWSPAEKTWNFTPSVAGELALLLKKVYKYENDLLAGPVAPHLPTHEEIDEVLEAVAPDEVREPRVSVGKFGTISVAVPYSEKFTAKAMGIYKGDLNGKWDAVNQIWVFPNSAAEKLGKTLKELFNFESPLLGKSEAESQQSDLKTISEMERHYGDLKAWADKQDTVRLYPVGRDTLERAGIAVSNARNAIIYKKKGPSVDLDKYFEEAKWLFGFAYPGMLDWDPDGYFVMAENFSEMAKKSWEVVVSQVGEQALSQPWKATLRLGRQLQGGDGVRFQVGVEPADSYTDTELHKRDMEILKGFEDVLTWFKSELTGWRLDRPMELVTRFGSYVPFHDNPGYKGIIPKFPTGGITTKGGYLLHGFLTRKSVG